MSTLPQLQANQEWAHNARAVINNAIKRIGGIGIISVKQYGAVGDGVTDDTAAIQRAIAASSGPLALFFPEGVYRITGTLTFTDRHVAIRGEGEGVTRLLCETVSTIIDFTDSYTGQDSLLVKRFTLEGMSFDKAIDTSDDAGGECINLTWSYAGPVSHTDHCRISNVVINGKGSARFWDVGIRITDGGATKINNVHINNQTGDSQLAKAGIVIERINATGCTAFFINNLVVHNFGAGIYLEHLNAAAAGTIEGIYITNSEIWANRFGIFDDNNSDTTLIVNGVHVVGSHIAASQSGIRLGVCSNVYLIGCNCNLNDFGESSGAGNTPYLNFVTSAAVVVIQGNRLYRNTSNTTTHNAINIPTTASRFIIANNVLENWTAVNSAGGGTRNVDTALIYNNTRISTGAPGNVGFHDRLVIGGVASVADDTVINFGQTFPSAPNVVACHSGTNTTINVTVTSITTTGFTCRHSNGATATGVQWIAAGPA
jgi:hypothetical protein